MMSATAWGLRLLSLAICFFLVVHFLLREYREDSSLSWLQVHSYKHTHPLGWSGGPKIPAAGMMYYGPQTARIDNASFLFLNGEDFCVHSCKAVANRIVISDGLQRPCGIYSAYFAMAECGALAFVYLPLW